MYLERLRRMTAAPALCNLRTKLGLRRHGDRPGSLLGACWGALGGLLGASLELLGALLEPLGASWACLGSPLETIRFLNATWTRLGCDLGPSWGRLGTILGSSWRLLGPLGVVSAPLGIVLGPLWRLLGPSWGHVGHLEAHCGEVAKTYKNHRFFKVLGTLRASKMRPSWAKLG